MAAGRAWARRYDWGMATLTVPQVYSLARNAGFPPDVARQMVAIAQRESSLNPGVYGDINRAAESSYGLWQINWKDAGIQRLLKANGITSPEQLYDPQTNARAAFLLWGGSARNLELAWYINRTGSQYGYAEKYRANLSRLPSAEALEGGYSGVIYAGGPSVAPGGSGAPPAPSGGGGEFDVDEFLTEIMGGGDDSAGLLLAAAGLMLTAAVLA